MTFPALFQIWMKPSAPYSPTPNSKPIDYSQDENWLALPSKEDFADVLAPGELDQQAFAKADVFFLHPTTHFGPDWNDPLDGSGNKLFHKSVTLKINASVFNGCCRVFAPRYRQGTMYSYSINESGPTGYAFVDVLAAFDHYMKVYNQGRPIILAGHSQGSDHGLLLLKNRFSDRPLLKKLVAAYLVGRPFEKENVSRELPDIPICQSREQIGCFMSWMTFGPQSRSGFEHSVFLSPEGIKFGESPDTICVNPLNWSTNEEWVDEKQHLGHFNTGKEEAQIVDQEQTFKARCDKGRLVIDHVFLGPFTYFGNYHILDYPLFYKNVRVNAVERVAAYLDSIAK